MRYNYDQGRFQDIFRPNNTYRGWPRYGQGSRGRSRYDPNYKSSYGYNMRGNQRYGDRIIIITEGETLEIKIIIGIGSRSYARQNRDRRGGGSISNSILGSGSRATTNRDRIRCLECREHDHFGRDCPTTQAKREAEQIQKMFNMDEDQTILQTMMMDIDQDGQTISPVVTRDDLNCRG